MCRSYGAAGRQTLQEIIFPTEKSKVCHGSVYYWRLLAQTVASWEYADAKSPHQRVLSPIAVRALHGLCNVARFSKVAEESIEEGAAKYARHISYDEIRSSVLEQARLTGHVLNDGVVGEEDLVTVVKAVLDPFTTLIRYCSALCMLDSEFVMTFPLLGLVQKCMELVLLRELSIVVKTQRFAEEVEEDAVSDVHMASTEDCEALQALVTNIARKVGVESLDGASFADPTRVNHVVFRCGRLLRRAAILSIAFKVGDGRDGF